MTETTEIENKVAERQVFEDLIEKSGREKYETIRENLIDFENLLAASEGATFGDSPELPLTHRFSDGMYVREIFIPKGTLLTGKIHKHDHPNFLMSGEVLVVTESKGKEYLSGPLTMISPPGTKRALYAITDVVWVTVHLNPTNTQDLDELEKIVIAQNYDEYEKFNRSGNSLMGKFKRFLIKKLSA